MQSFLTNGFLRRAGIAQIRRVRDLLARVAAYISNAFLSAPCIAMCYVASVLPTLRFIVGLRFAELFVVGCSLY